MATKKANPRERESYVYLYLDGKKVGEFGPYQTMRAALADAKTMAISRRDVENANGEIPAIVHTIRDRNGQDKAYEVMADYRQTDEDLAHSFVAAGFPGKTAAARSGSPYVKPAVKATSIHFNPKGKKAATAKKASGSVTVKWDDDWGEYCVTKGRSTYHTNDYADAIGTAHAMAKGGTVVDKVAKSKRKNPQISFLAHGKPVSFFAKKGKK